MCALPPEFHCEHQKSLRKPFVEKGHSPSDDLPALEAREPEGELGLAIAEARAIVGLAFPMAATGLLLYSRSLVSMVFLGRLGRLPLAGGALAAGFANITGYSVLSGLAMGMEPISAQAFGAGSHAVLRLAFRRTVLLLLAASIPVAALWAATRRLLLLCGQDPGIAAAAHAYLLASLPDLLLQSLLHPLRAYLRAQSINLPLAAGAAAALLLHLPLNHLLVSSLRLGVRGVALASVLYNLNLFLFLLAYVRLSGRGVELKKTTLTAKGGSTSLHGWKQLLSLALPSCISVCLEWWWYEIMILLCGLLPDPESAVAAVGVLIQTTSLIYIFPSSLGFAVSTRVGHQLGADRPDRARRAATVGLACGAALGIAALVFTVAVRGGWARMFTADQRIAGLTAAVLPVVGMCELGNCPQTAGCGVLRGSARPRAGANINLGSFYGVGMPVAVGLAFFAGLDFRGLWFGLLAAQATCAVLMLAVVLRTDWPRQAERARRLTGGAAPGHGRDATIEFDVEKDAIHVAVPGTVDGDENNSSLVVVTVNS